ncbi:neutral amino acid transport system permease protein [Collimonas sp. OK307]|nr:neutral amino acid transport system permease protein [Collimonas sp. OK307]
MVSDIFQHLINGLMLGAVLALPALGLTLIFSVLGFVNFSIAAQMTAGAYAGWLANSYGHWSLVPCVAVSFVFAGLLGVLGDRLALFPMRKRATANTPLMVAIVSIALNLILENAFRFIFGNGLNSYEFDIARDIHFANFRIGPQQAQNLLIALVIAGVLAAFFSLTRLGKAMRAVADNPDLARLKGINPTNLSAVATFIGMGLAGIGGSLLAIDTSADPSTGGRLMLLIFAASVVGGLSSLSGAIFGALLIGVASELSVMVVAPVYQTAVAFLSIVLILLIKPAGLFSGFAGAKR